MMGERERREKVRVRREGWVKGGGVSGLHIINVRRGVQSFVTQELFLCIGGGGQRSNKDETCFVCQKNYVCRGGQSARKIMCAADKKAIKAPTHTKLEIFYCFASLTFCLLYRELDIIVYLITN